MRQPILSRSAALRVSVAAVLSATLVACSDTAEVLGVNHIDPLFASYVSLGNSITAGYQSGGINDSTQHESYALLLAEQMKTRFAIPTLNHPGCPPPIINFITQVREGNGTSTTCALRDIASITYALNNVAVPGATSFDPIASSTSASNALTTFVLGGKSQAERARDARPTFASVWIGNNDVLAPAVSGILTPLAGVSPGITPQAQFEANYDSLVKSLKSIPTLKGGVLIGVVHPTAAPVLFSARALFIPQFKAALDAAAGGTILVSPTCTPTTTSLISFSIILQMQAGLARVIGCEKNSIPGTLVGDIFVLDAAEQTELDAVVTAYNNHIQAVADANGFAYWDPNVELVALRASGCILEVPNIGSATQPFGPCITLDGIHPSGFTHRVIANALIAVINAKYSTSLATIPNPVP